jgi:DNA polymerase-3 subunit alpha
LRVAADGKKVIRYGLSAVRNVGEGVVAHIVRARNDDDGGAFRDFHDFCDRVDPAALNKRTVESLAKAGAFDSLGHTRKGIVDIHESTIERAVKHHREREAGIMSLFADTNDPAEAPVFDDLAPIGTDEYPKARRLAFEKEMLGLYVSDHPLLGVEHALRRLVDGPLGALREKQEGDTCRVGGIVTGLSRRYTRKGDQMATFVLEDLGAAVEVMVFPRVMAEYGHVLVDDAIVCVRGRLDLRDDQPKIVAGEISAPEISIDDGDAPIRIQVRLAALSDAKVVALKDLLLRHPGNCPVFSHLLGPDTTTVIRLGDEFRVEPRNALYAELRELFGPDCLA